MASQGEIESFLKAVKTKILVFGIAFRPREKNLQALADLDITSKSREEIILSLQVVDYCSGPNKDLDVPGKPDYYVFGKSVNGKEVYIKLSPGLSGKMVDCMSFHSAEHSLSYPFKSPNK
jgi:hypothetical protein